MGLISGYSSDSSNDSLSDTAEINSKRHLKPTKQESKLLKKQRKGNDPWAAWESSEEDEPLANQLISNQKESALSMLESAGLATLENEEISESDIQEFSQFFINKHYTENNITKPRVREKDFVKETTKLKCYLPKKILHTYKGHVGGTNDIKYFPKTAHLFLSGGNDKTVKLWDMYHDRQLLREYNGGNHQAVRRLGFDSSGKKFLSSSYEKFVKLWDTEAGKVIHTFSLPAESTTIQFNPKIDDEFLVGLSNSEIKHFDIRDHRCVQTYDQHMSSVLDLEFFPDGSKFISTSEDKTVRIWNTGINITIRHISDTNQYAMPFVKIHPSHKVFLTQGMDSVARTYQMTPKYKQQKKKFVGHDCAGHGIGLSCSPDGRYLVSGDSKGKLMIWDWNTTKVLKSFQVDRTNKPVSIVAWSPQETSKVLCSGSVGKIQLYD
ncbi:hypothetical protein ACO0RG_004071 [Hanseniaspora osmophila]